MAGTGTSNNSHIEEERFRETAVGHLDGLYAYAMTLTCNRAEAEGLVQETYLRAMNAFGHLRPESNLKNWLFTILRNIRLNQVGNRLDTPSIIEMDEPGRRHEFQDKPLKGPLSLYFSKVQEADVRAAIEKLPDAYREVIVLREFEEFSYEEIAQVLDCPVGTVMSKLSRAREKLKDMLLHWNPITSEVQARQANDGFV